MKYVWMVHYLRSDFGQVVDHFDSVWDDFDKAYERRDYLEETNGKTRTWKGSTISKLPLNEAPKQEVTP